MNIINRYPVWAGVIACGAMLAGVWSIFSGGRPANNMPVPRQVYVSGDDGRTWQRCDVLRLADANAPARAHVFRCEKDGKEFVGYLERFKAGAVSAEVKELAGVLAYPLSSMVELKRPGGKTWLQGGSSADDAIRQASCPSGDGGEVVEVLP